MAEEKVLTLSEALGLLGHAVTFREESEQQAFDAFVAGLAEGEATEPEDLDELTKAELLGKAEALGLDVSPHDTKAEIQAAIEAAEETEGVSS